MVKLIVTDLDGTLFKSDHLTISERNIRALKKARERGIKVAISSGRVYCLLKDVIKILGGVDCIMTSNGAASFDSEGRLISSDLIEYEKWREIYEMLKAEGIVTEIYCRGNTYLDRELFKDYKNPSLSPLVLDTLKSTMLPCGSVIEELKGEGAEKLHSICISGEAYSRFKAVFENMGIEVTSSIPHNMEINKRGVNKGRGLEKLCETLGIELNEVMAFGDEENDIEMLKAAGFSFAVENASEAVKAAAGAVTEGNDNDGVAVQVEKLL